MYKSRLVLEIARDLRAFVELNAGLVRGAVSGSGENPEKLAQAQKRVAGLRKRLAAKDKQLARLQAGSSPGVGAGTIDNVDPKKIVWIFGSARTGSTWLSNMMEEMANQTMWREPLVGQLFGALGGFNR